MAIHRVSVSDRLSVVLDGQPVGEITVGENEHHQITLYAHPPLTLARVANVETDGTRMVRKRFDSRRRKG